MACPGTNLPSAEFTRRPMAAILAQLEPRPASIRHTFDLLRRHFLTTRGGPRISTQETLPSVSIRIPVTRCIVN